MITLAPRGAKSASTAAPGKLLSRCTSNGVLPYSSLSNHVSEQNSCRSGSCGVPVLASHLSRLEGFEIHRRETWGSSNACVLRRVSKFQVRDPIYVVSQQLAA